MIKKPQLFTPGPVTVPPEVLAATAEPIVHHRAPEFDPIFKKVSEDLKYVFQTSNPVVTFASSGTGAMEASVVNFHSPGDEMIVIEGGKFGERWAEIGRAYGLTVHTIAVEWGQAASPQTVREALKAHPNAKSVYATLVETSTGTMTDVAAIAPVVKEHGALFIVDAVSALGAEVLKTDEWKIDVVVTGSQKALMLPPGLAFAALSGAAGERMKTANGPSYYVCFEKALKNLEE
ncbi:MAG: aminotransferase class V-fold PLP-dependent enzyme, partial [bacterium]